MRTVPQIRTYFSSDVIPVLETQRSNYDYLVSTSKIDFLGPLVLIIGVIVILDGLLMVFLAWRGRSRFGSGRVRVTDREVDLDRCPVSSPATAISGRPTDGSSTTSAGGASYGDHIADGL